MLSSWEAHVTHQTGVALYDGNDKVNIYSASIYEKEFVLNIVTDRNIEFD